MTGIDFAKAIGADPEAAQNPAQFATRRVAATRTRLPPRMKKPR
jgi:hypothetical protein